MDRAAQRYDGDLIRVVVANDHPLYLDAIVHSLEATGDIIVVGQASNAANVLHLTREQLPDLVLLDVSMHGPGLNVARNIHIVCPTTKIIMLTAAEEEDTLLQALKAGASGYLLKGLSDRDLASAVRAIHAGGIYVAPPLASRLLAEMNQPGPTSSVNALTAREREVLELVVQGLSNREIGERLTLAEKTIKHYMTNILTKLHVRSRVEAALLGQKVGLGSS